MSYAARATRGLVVPSLLGAALAGCSNDDSVLVSDPFVAVAPSSVNVVRQQQVQLTATLAGVPAGTALRWQSQDSAVFRLDTTTTGPHRVVGVGGRCSGGTIVTVTAARGATVAVPVVVTRTMEGGSTVCLGG